MTLTTRRRTAMKKMMLAMTAGLLLALPAACMCPGHHGPGGPGGPGCPQHQGCDCKCRQQSDCPSKPDCPNKPESQQKPDCPQHRQQDPPPPAK